MYYLYFVYIFIYFSEKGVNGIKMQKRYNMFSDGDNIKLLFCVHGLIEYSLIVKAYCLFKFTICCNSFLMPNFIFT